MLCCERWLLDSKSDPVIFFSVCWQPCVPGPAALPATQIAEWYVHNDLCNKTMRSQESTDWRLEGAPLPASCRELKWQWQLIRSSLNAVDSERAESGLSGTAGRGASAAGVKMAGSTAEQILRVIQE